MKREETEVNETKEALLEMQPREAAVMAALVVAVMGITHDSFWLGAAFVGDFGAVRAALFRQS